MSRMRAAISARLETGDAVDCVGSTSGMDLLHRATERSMRLYPMRRDGRPASSKMCDADSPARYRLMHSFLKASV